MVQKIRRLKHRLQDQLCAVRKTPSLRTEAEESVQLCYLGRLERAAIQPASQGFDQRLGASYVRLIGSARHQRGEASLHEVRRYGLGAGHERRHERVLNRRANICLEQAE